MNKRMSVADAVKVLKKIRSDQIQPKMDAQQVDHAFSSILSLEKRFAQNQPVNVVHWPTGLGSADFLQTNVGPGYSADKHHTLSDYHNYVKRMTIKLHGSDNVRKLYSKGKAYKSGILNCITNLEMHNHDALATEIRYARSIILTSVCINFYTKKGFNDPEYPYYNNLLGIIRRPSDGYIRTIPKYSEIVMPISSNTLLCLISFDISSLETECKKDISEALTERKQPKQMSLI